MTPPLDLSVLIVSWNVSAWLERCLVSIETQTLATTSLDSRVLHGSNATVEVIVVDNASSDDTVARVQSKFPWVRLHVNTENVGFARANNTAMRLSHGNALLFLNPDTEVNFGALDTLLACLAARPDVAVVGPRLRYADGSTQSSRRRFPTLGTLFFESTLLEQWFPHNRFVRAYRYEQETDDHDQTVDWLVGACLLVRAETMQRVGGWDEKFFMYSEELDLCRRIRETGAHVLFTPRAEVIHHEGKSSEQVVAARHIRFQTSKIRYAAKYHGRRVAGVLRFFLLATYVWQAADEALKWLAGHKRPLRAARLQAYGQVLKTGLRWN